MEARMRKEKLLFNGFMESFNLSVLLRFIGIVLDDGDAAGDTVLSKPSPIAVIYPYSLNREGSNVQEVVNEVTGSNKGFVAGFGLETNTQTLQGLGVLQASGGTSP